MLEIFSPEDFALKSKLWPPKFLAHCPIFSGNSRFTGISQLRAGKTRSKRPRSHCLSTGHLLPYMWASFHLLDPSRYLSSFSSWNYWQYLVELRAGSKEVSIGLWERSLHLCDHTDQPAEMMMIMSLSSGFEDYLEVYTKLWCFHIVDILITMMMPHKLPSGRFQD